MPIDLYASYASTPSRAVLMALKHLSIDVNLKTIDLIKAEQLKPQFLKLNPAHIIPTIVDGNLILWESGAIMQYLVNKYAPNSPLYPTDPEKRAIVDRTLYTNQTLMEAIRIPLRSLKFWSTETTEETDTAPEQEIQNYKTNLKLMDQLIGDNRYVAGDELTIADFAVLATITLLFVNNFKDLNDYPKLKAWFYRLNKELPYYEEINGQLANTYKQKLQSINKNVFNSKL